MCTQNMVLTDFCKCAEKRVCVWAGGRRVEGWVGGSMKVVKEAGMMHFCKRVNIYMFLCADFYTIKEKSLESCIGFIFPFYYE